LTLFEIFFEVSSSIGKLGDLLGHFDEKDKVDFNKFHFLLNNDIMMYVHTSIV